MTQADEKKKVLLVDDDEIHLVIAETMLKDEYVVLCAKSGKEALDMLCHGSIPNLILLDIVMPNMDGWETFNRIRAISLLQNVPIAFLTSIEDASGEQRANDMGAADYIMKPYDKKDLMDRIQHLIGS